MNERRTRQRNLCSDIVEVFWSDQSGWPHRANAVLEDISATGACIQIDTLIPVKAEVAVRMGESGFPGHVRYCTLVGGSYFVGVEFTGATRWIPEDYNPKHILSWPLPQFEHAALGISESFLE